MSIAVGDVIQVECGGGNTETGVRWVFTHSYRVTTAPASPAEEYAFLALVADTFAALVQTYLIPLFTDQVFLIAIRAQRLYPTKSVIGISLQDDVGGASGAPPEPNSAVLGSFYTGKAGRRGRGRVYLPPPPSTDAPGGLLTEADAGDWDLAIEAVFLASISPDSSVMAPVVMSVADYTESPVTTTAAAVILDTAVDRVIRRQSRRDYRYPIFIAGSEP